MKTEIAEVPNEIQAIKEDGDQEAAGGSTVYSAVSNYLGSWFGYSEAPAPADKPTEADDATALASNLEERLEQADEGSDSSEIGVEETATDLFMGPTSPVSPEFGQNASDNI